MAQQKRRTILNQVKNMAKGRHMNFYVVAGEHVEKAHNSTFAHDHRSKIIFCFVSEDDQNG